MPKASTIKYAKEKLSPEEFTAWESMPVKLSKKQMKAGERPPGFAPAEPVEAKPKAGATCAEDGCEAPVPGGVQGMAHCKAHASQPKDEDEDEPEDEGEETEGFVEALVQAAANHGEESGTEHEITDHLMIITALWECMGSKSRERATDDEHLQQLLADWLEEDEDEGDEGTK